MKTKIYTLVFSVMAITASVSGKAQTTATNYDFIDCNGNSQSIFADLDAGKALILEFFMTSCSPCITAGQTLEAMKADLLAEFPGMIKAYAFGYTNSYSCSAINSWVTANGITSIPADSGAYQVAYYGGMGMPTIVILGGGTSHAVLGSPYLSYTTADTAIMANDIRNFLNPSSVADNSAVSNLNLFPNPANDQVNISFETSGTSDVIISLLDISGRLVSNIAEKKDQIGKIVESVNISQLAEGFYIVKIEANGLTTQQKLNIVH
jgi:hypothetical protein